MGVRRTSGGDYDLSNPVDSFIDVVRRVVLQPVAFFRGLPPRGSLLNPLVFALICTEVSAILGGILRLAGVGEGFVAGDGFQVPENQEIGEFIGSRDPRAYRGHHRRFCCDWHRAPAGHVDRGNY